MRHFLRNIQNHDKFIEMCILSGGFVGFSMAQMVYYDTFKNNIKMSYQSYFCMTSTCTVMGGVTGVFLGPILPELFGLGLLIYPIHEFTTYQLEKNRMQNEIDKLKKL